MDRSEAWFLAATAAVLGLIAGMAWVGFNPDGRWLYNYQGLVSGALAVLAALVTVGAMWRSDDRQQARFESQLDLQLRPDKTAVAAASFAIPSLTTDARTIQYVSGRLALEMNERADELPDISLISMLFVIYAKVTEEMESEVINNCYRFFTPAMMRQYAMIIADLKDIKKHHAVYVSFFGEDHDKIVLPRKIGQNINEAIFSNDDTDSIRKMRSSTREAVRILSHTCKGIFNFVDGLSDIEESYR